MFDLNDTIELEMPSEDGVKVCAVRHPTEEEWCKRFEMRSTVIRNVGKGETETKPLHREEADAALLSTIQLNKEVAFDETEAVILMDQLSLCEVTDVVRNGGTITVSLNTVLGEVSHIVKMPGHSELKATTEDCVRVRGGRFGQTTITIKLHPAIILYDKIIQNVEGYSPADAKKVPAIHKYKVIDCLQGQVNELMVRSKKEVPTMTPGR